MFTLVRMEHHVYLDTGYAGRTRNMLHPNSLDLIKTSILKGFFLNSIILRLHPQTEVVSYPTCCQSIHNPDA